MDDLINIKEEVDFYHYFDVNKRLTDQQIWLGKQRDWMETELQTIRQELQLIQSTQRDMAMKWEQISQKIDASENVSINRRIVLSMLCTLFVTMLLGWFLLPKRILPLSQSALKIYHIGDSFNQKMKALPKNKRDMVLNILTDKK